MSFKYGDYLVICDRSGQKFYRSECRMTWDGLLVHKSKWDPKHPQLDIKPHKDDISVEDARPRQSINWADGQSPDDAKAI